MARQNRAERQARLAPQEPEAPLSRDQLYEQAKAAGIKGASKFNRDQLTAALAATNGAAPNADDQAAQATRVEEAVAHYQAQLADPDAPKPAEGATERSHLARQEVEALKAWQLGGMKGDRPSTPNYDFIAALYVGAAKVTRTKGSTRRAPASRAKDGGPRGIEAAQAKAKAGGKRGAGTKISDEALRDYIVKVHAEYPESSRQDEREFAYWVEKLALSGRWPRFWKEVVDGVAPADDEPDEDVISDDPKVVIETLNGDGAVSQAEAARVSGHKHDGEDVEAVLASTKKATRKAPTKKATPAKRDVTPIPKAPAKKRAGRK